MRGMGKRSDRADTLGTTRKVTWCSESEIRPSTAGSGAPGGLEGVAAHG